MPTAPLHLAVVIEEFVPGSPSQQLVDRFLTGYPSAGDFIRPDWKVTVALGESPVPDALQQRVRDFGVSVTTDPVAAVREAQAVLIVWRGTGHQPNDTLLDSVMTAASRSTRVFVHGLLASSGDIARKALENARNIQLLAGSPLPLTWRFPEVDLPRNSRIEEALVVVQGPPGAAEWHALEALLPVIERRRRGEQGVRSLRRLTGNEVWDAAEQGKWSWQLLAAALSRSDTPQGDSVTDGRTQDLVGLGVVPRLAKTPRAWLLEHHDGLRSALLVLEGVVSDYNFAVRQAGGSILSAQIHRPPRPGDHQYSRLAAALNPYFASGIAPWSAGRSLFISQIMWQMANPAV